MIPVEKLTAGKIVHFVQPEIDPAERGMDAESLLEEFKELVSLHLAAIVTRVYHKEVVRLKIFGVDGFVFPDFVEQFVQHSPENKPGSWHWLHECKEE